MKRKRFTEEQIIEVLKQAEAGLKVAGRRELDQGCNAVEDALHGSIFEFHRNDNLDAQGVL